MSASVHVGDSSLKVAQLVFLLSIGTFLGIFGLALGEVVGLYAGLCHTKYEPLNLNFSLRVGSSKFRDRDSHPPQWVEGLVESPLLFGVSLWHKVEKTHSENRDVCRVYICFTESILLQCSLHATSVSLCATWGRTLRYMGKGILFPISELLRLMLRDVHGCYKSQLINGIAETRTCMFWF